MRKRRRSDRKKYQAEHGPEYHRLTCRKEKLRKRAWGRRQDRLYEYTGPNRCEVLHVMGNSFRWEKMKPSEVLQAALDIIEFHETLQPRYVLK